MKDLISISDASEKFSVYPNTLRRWIRLGAIAAQKDDGGCWLLSQSEIRKLVLARLKTHEKAARKNG